MRRIALMLWVYVGTYTGDGSRGIYLLELDPSTGALASRGLVAVSPNPSFLAAHPGARYLYAVNEVDGFRGQPGGGVSAFAVDARTGALGPLNQQSSRGAGPCFVTVDRGGKNALVANYVGGSVACLPIGDDGRLGPATGFVQHEGSVADPRRQGGPHAHSINLDAAGKFAVAADLGLDELLVYRFDPAKGTLTPNDPRFTKLALRSGPRHFAFHPDGRHAYAINEIGMTVVALDYDPARGTLTEIQSLPTTPDGVRAGYSTADLHVHPSGRFLYGSNRGHDSIAIFAVDPESGRLRPIGHQPTGGKTPRNFGIDPSGRFLLAANQDSGTVVVFRIDPESGRLEPTGSVAEVPRPVCVTFVPKGE